MPSGGQPEPAAATAEITSGHFSCSLSVVLLARVRDYGGEGAVAELLRRAGSHRTVEELSDIVNWISYDEAIALWRAGAEITHHPHFARAVGEDSARRLNSSHVAALLRSLGSPEAVYASIATTSTKYSTVARLEAVDSGPGYARIVAIPSDGFSRAAEHCAWTMGLLSQPTMLFGLPAAHVEHECCAAFGAPACEYRVTWPADQSREQSESSEQLAVIQDQLEAMKERVRSMYQTASDLISAGRLEDVLARITDRAASEVRAPRYLLAVRMPAEQEVHIHHRGFSEEEAERCAERVLDRHPVELPDSWLVVPVRSNRHDYGRLLAMYDTAAGFFPQERELFQVYSRYAASALDSASSLLEAERRYRQSSALLGLARSLAAAGTSNEVTRRLAESVPAVVDCDRVGVYLWDAPRGELVRSSITQGGQDPPVQLSESRWTPSSGSVLDLLVRDPEPDPIFVDEHTGDPRVRRLFSSLGFSASILVPLVAPGQFLGLLSVSVFEHPERLRLTSDLVDRLSGVAAQATTALQNGQLLDQITYQAMHDQLTGLANRVQFTTQLRAAVHEAREQRRELSLFYLDLDRFKPVNDEYGHEVGDALLIAVSERLKSCTRAEDGIARLGGDEFAILVRSDAPEGLGDFPERVRAAFQDPFTVGGHELRVGASVGRSVYPVDAEDAEGLLRHADAAMFEAKRARIELSPGAPRSGTPAVAPGR
jgi:diguanylate cyclase (GGDEF)-like protein